MFIYLNFIYNLYTVSSPYLLVFGDDRVCVTREQMMLQVVLVKLNIEEGLDGKGFMEFIIISFYDVIKFSIVLMFINYRFEFFYNVIKF